MPPMDCGSESPTVDAQPARPTASDSAAAAFSTRIKATPASRDRLVKNPNRMYAQRHSCGMAEPLANELICPNQGSHGNRTGWLMTGAHGGPAEKMHGFIES